jgi:sugar phosphate isomerase/epimerase
MQGRWGEDVTRDMATGWLGEALVELGDYARQYGQPLIYEPLNRYETNLCNTLGAGVSLLESLGAPNVVLLGDVFHMNIEEVNIGQAIRAAGRHLGHVHLVDSNRRAAGMGHLDFDPIAASLRDIGYSRYVSAEALSLPDPLSAARQSVQRYQQLFS